MNLIILILATYRLTRLLIIDNGPFDIFDFIRTKLYNEGWRVEEKSSKGIKLNLFDRLSYTINGAFECPYCMGLWCALIVIILQSYIPVLSLILAIAGGQYIIEDYFHND